MIDFFQSVFAFILALGILITFHEFGHYWVATRFNVKILKFSIGFGRPIWRFDFEQPFWQMGFTNSPWKLSSWKNLQLFQQRDFSPDETEFVLAALPLGGYVKMLDEREAQVSERESQYAFNNKTLLQRLAIVLAGPIFNFIFAIIAYWFIYMIGVVGLKPIVDQVEEDSIAMEAGFSSGQEIFAVDGVRIYTWTSFADRIVANIINSRNVAVQVVGNNNFQDHFELDLSRLSIDDMAGGMLLSKIGIKPKLPEYPAILGDVLPDGAADKSGMMSGDEIVKADETFISSWTEWVEYVRSHPGEPMKIESIRDGQSITLTVTPEARNLESGEVVGRIGVALDNNYQKDDMYFALDSYTVIPAMIKALERTREMSIMTLKILGKMIVGEASVKNLSGPITIAKYAGDTANLGVVAFLGFLAIVSISLGVLNLLPVPLLDGGHILYYLIEAIRGKPLSESFQIVGQQFGLVLLFGLMGLALYNDILRVIG